MASYSGNYYVHTYESDRHGRSTPAALFGFFVDAASTHAMTLGFGFDDMRGQGYAWVLSRFLLRIERFPQWRDTVRVETWPSGIERLFALRDFSMEGQDGATVARATSSWLAVDVERRAPERIERIPLDRRVIEERRVLDRSAGKVAGSDAWHPGVGVNAVSSDVDLNNHVGSHRLLQWCLDALPYEQTEGRLLAELETNFVAEVQAGDRLESQWSPLPGASDGFVHRIVRLPEGTEVCRARSQWKR